MINFLGFINMDTWIVIIGILLMLISGFSLFMFYKIPKNLRNKKFVSFAWLTFFLGVFLTFILNIIIGGFEKLFDYLQNNILVSSVLFICLVGIIISFMFMGKK